MVTLPPELEADAQRADHLLRFGQWGLELLTTVRRVSPAILAQPFRADDRELLRRRNTLAECFDTFGTWVTASRAVAESDEVRARLRSRAPAHQTVDTELVREQIRFVANHARSRYRAQQFKDAERLLYECRDLLTSAAMEPAGAHADRQRSRNQGLLGAVNYYLGCCLRQRGHAKAEDFYRDAIENFRRRAQGARSNDELAAVRHRAAICLGLGLGWWTRNSGLLSRSRTLFSTAELWLRRSERDARGGNASDPIHGAYLDVLRSSVLRALRQDLPEARSLLTSAYDTFRHKPFQHKPYAARAVFQLALCEMADGDFKSARAHIKALDAVAERNPRLKSNVHILLSRLARFQRTGSGLRQAGAAVDIMEHNPEKEGLFEALVARAEAHLGVNNREAALADLREARKQGTDQNPKIAAVAALHIAKTLLLMGRRSEAADELARWRLVKDRVEHAYVQELGAEVEALSEAELRIGFEIPANPDDLHHEAHIRNLQRWLVARAREKFPGDVEQQVKALGIKRATIYNWERAGQRRDEPKK